MLKSVDFVNIIMILAVAQGLFLSLLIFQKYGNLYANRFLATNMLLYSLTIFNMLLTDLGYNLIFPHAILILNSVIFLIAPLHYLYARHLTNSSRRMTKTDWVHFTPFFLYLLYIFPNLFQAREEVLPYIQFSFQTGFSPEYLIFYWLLPVQCLIYLSITLFVLRVYSIDIKNVFSSIDKIKLTWLRNITYIFIAVLFIFFTENIFYLQGSSLSHLFRLTSLIFAIAVYVMGYIGLLRSEIFIESQFSESLNQIPELKQLKNTNQQENGSILKYEKSGLSDKNAEEHTKNLLELMQKKKPYKDSTLTLTQLAKLLSVSPHNLSEILNTRLNMNFFDFINQYRVDETKKQLVNPENQNLKILEVGFSAGFNSKTSFNTIFKKYTKTTPSQYRQKALEKNIFTTENSEKNIL